MALELGLLPHELGERMLAYEEAMLMAFYKQSPWGGERMDANFAQLCQLLHGVHAPKGKQRPIKDFLLFWRKPESDDESVSRQVRTALMKMKRAPSEGVHWRPFK